MKIHQKPEGGPWNDPQTWIEGVVPTTKDIVTVTSVTVVSNTFERLTFTLAPETRVLNFDSKTGWQVDPCSHPEWATVNGVCSLCQSAGQ